MDELHCSCNWPAHPPLHLPHSEPHSNHICHCPLNPVRLLDVLDLYKPVVWEYSRLNITNTVLSKRKLNKLVTQNHVNGWDDPR